MDSTNLASELCGYFWQKPAVIVGPRILEPPQNFDYRNSSPSPRRPLPTPSVTSYESKNLKKKLICKEMCEKC
ncbi:hypothetical protein Avbf_16602 [Armadillidium vulgare]|nr:hypothetical protein Avbf_16602 [Armadillidium vulgare]